MIQTIKKVLTSLSLSLLVAVPLMAVAAPTVSAQNDNISNGLSCGANLSVSNISSSPSSCGPVDDGQAGQKVDNIIKLIINIFSLLVGVVAVIMIIVGGLKYITSGGDSGNVSGAKNTILYAIIGLVVVALAQIVVKFVLSKTVAPS
jgi:hypothetical protein